MSRNIVLSVDKINAASICPKLYYYQQELRKVPIKKADYFEEGELMHEALKVLYQSIIDKNRVELGFLLAHTRNYATNLSLSSEQVEQVTKDVAMYYEYYRSETWLIEAAEEPFAKELYEGDDIRVILNGKVDLRIITNNGKGPRVIVDHKYEASFREKRDRDNQALAYTWAYETKDWIYNLIGKQKSYTPDKRLQRIYFNYSQTQIDEWLESVIYLAYDIAKYQETNTWPMRYSGCNFHGNRCTFYDVDNTTKDNRERLLAQNFMDKDDKTVMERV